MVYLVVGMVVVCAFCSLAVDLGRVQLAKTELRAAADAAARYAVTGIESDTAVSRAIAAAAQNKADGSPVVLAATDVTVGNWDAAKSPQFSTTRSPLNAVQVSASRTAARQQGIPLLFASVIGARTCDIRATAIARRSPGIPNGFIGLSGITIKNNATSESYDASKGTNPNSSSYLDSGMLGSNGTIDAQNNEVAGLVVLGAGGTTNVTASQPPKVLSAPIPTPTLDFSGAPLSNPDGVSKDFTVTGTRTLSGGSYYFTKITLKNQAMLTFSAPAKLYVDGDIFFAQNGSIIAYNRTPANLYIQQRGAGTIFGGSPANNVEFVGTIDAPQTAFIAYNGTALMGRATFLTITMKNNAVFYFDESLHAFLPNSPPNITLVK